MYDISLLTCTILSVLDMHALPISDKRLMFGRTSHTNQSAISQPRRMANIRQVLHVSSRICQVLVAHGPAVCTEEVDREAMTEKKRGGKITSGERFDQLPAINDHSASVAAANTPRIVFV